MVSNTTILCLLLLTPTILMIVKQHKQKKEYENEIKLLKEQIEKNTVAFENSNSKIENYAYMNSHEVRGPLARILGMIYLIDIHSVSAEDGYERIKEAAVQLDEVIHLINSNLDEQKESNMSTKHDEKISCLKKLA